MKNIVIVENREIISESLNATLLKEPGLSICIVSDPVQLFKRAWNSPPDLVIMDKVMPYMNAVETIQEIKKRWSDTKTLIFTAKSAEKNILRAFQAGANGYILHNAGKDEMIFAVMHLLSGFFYVSPQIMPLVIQGFCQAQLKMLDNLMGKKLSTRERELLKLIAEGNKNKDIANILCLSVKTVETHRYNLMKKLDIHNIADLTVFAGRAGVI